MISFRLLVLLLALITTVYSINDPYATLEIDRNADDKTIKSAYRQLSKKYHPDKNPSPEAHEKFIEIGEAYEILSDETKKQNFDQFGNPDGPGGGHGGGAEFDFGDIFSQFFGGGGGPGGGNNRGPRRGGDTEANLHIALSDFYNGKDVDFDVDMTNNCDVCHGSGSADGKKHTCDQCNGQGMVMLTKQFGPGMMQRMRMQCDKCQGSGHLISHHCKSCGGEGTVVKSRHYNVYVRKGTKRNDAIVLQGEGDQNPQWVPGDLIIRLREDLTKSWGYRRIGDAHLYRTEALTWREAADGGWSRRIAMFGSEHDEEEHVVQLKRDKGKVVLDGEVEVIKGRGMPIVGDDDDEDRHGDLYVEYRVIANAARDMVKDEL